MKNAAHPIHPAVVEAIAALNSSLESVYQSGDYSFTVQVEGQVVASKNTKEEVAPVAWEAGEIEAETAKRVISKVADQPEASAVGE